MAFRGKDWYPPSPTEVAATIQDKLTITELSPDVLKALLDNATIESGTISEEELQEKLGELRESTSFSLANANATHYASLKTITKSTSNVEKVNIVLPVYNSIGLTLECIKAVLAHTYWPYHLTIVDDASDEMTHTGLEEVAKQHSDKITLLTNRKNRGFAATVNRGIKEFELTTKYTVLLNSDVLVTPYWLTKMVVALNSNPRNKIVNPVTNNTAVINVSMNAGYSYITMNDVLERTAARLYPEVMPTGFCFLVPNTLFGAIGYMDESYANFGEETDFWMRTITWSDGVTFDRWRAVLADDTYVFHQRGASYATLGEEIHMNLRKTASARFRQQWPSWQTWNKSFDVPKTMKYLRKSRSADLLHATLKSKKFSGTSVCFLTHSVETCGGMHFIADIVNYINEHGGDARVACILRDEVKKPGEPVAELRCAPSFFKSVEGLYERFTSEVFQNGIVIAATAELAPMVTGLCQNNPGLTPVLHVQSYEPALIPDPDTAEQFKTNFRLIPNVISSSHWITNELKTEYIKSIATINPGVDRSVFYPKDRSEGDDRPTVLISMNGAYHFKGAERGLQLALHLQAIAKQERKDIRIMAIGAAQIPSSPGILCQGSLARTRIANLLATEVDVFVDPAHNHSYGMPSLEAIACGVCVTGWDNRGIREYLPVGYTSGKDLIAPNDTPVPIIATMVFNLLFNDKARLEAAEAQRKAALIDHHDRSKNAEKMAKVLKGLVGLPKLNIVVVTPHARKHGGPTTLITMANCLAERGHNVKIATVYSDLNPGVISYTDLPIILLNQKLDNLPECDVIITNSDNPLNEQISTTPKAKRKIMLKLSHNPRFKSLEEQGLRLKWDAIVTSTQWLADVCENPAPDWNYAPVKAHRIGWYHYNFESMRRSIKRKKYHELNDETIVISTLVHGHPTKGSGDAGAVLNSIYQHYKGSVKFIGVGEVHPDEVKIAIPNMEYVFAPSRDALADIMAKTDIWLSCSHGEGLGRMALEAMTGAAACVLTDTGAEYVADMHNAIVVPVKDLDGLANSINSLIADTELRKKIGMTGYLTAKQMSDPSEFISNLEKVIGDVI